MVKCFALILLLFMAGCQSPKPSTGAKALEDTELVFVMATPDGDGYAVEAHWLSFKQMISEDYKIDGVVDVLAAPKISGQPNKWLYAKAASYWSDYTAEAVYPVGAEMVDVSVQPGLHFKVMVEPLENERIRLKGIVLLSKAVNDEWEVDGVPFNVECKIGEPVGVRKTVIKMNTDALADLNDLTGRKELYIAGIEKSTGNQPDLMNAILESLGLD